MAANENMLEWISQLIAEKDRLIHEKDELVASKDRIWRELHNIIREKDAQIRKWSGGQRLLIQSGQLCQDRNAS